MKRAYVAVELDGISRPEVWRRLARPAPRRGWRYWRTYVLARLWDWWR